MNCIVRTQKQQFASDKSTRVFGNTDHMKFIAPSELITGKWYVALELDSRLEDSVVAGPFDSLVDAESHPLPDELIPSQFSVFQFDGG